MSNSLPLVASLREVHNFISEHDRDADFVLDNTEVDPALISRYDTKEGAFPGKLESAELLRLARLHAPTLVDALAITEERNLNRRWQTLLVHADEKHFPCSNKLKNVLTTLLPKGYSFSEVVSDFEELEKLFPSNKPGFLDLYEVLRSFEYLTYKGADPEWLLNHFRELPEEFRSDGFYSSNLQRLWGKLSEVGNAQQAMGFIDKLARVDYQLIRTADNYFYKNLQALRDAHMCEKCDRLPLIPDERQKQLVFTAPLMMAYPAGEDFIDYPLPILIERGVKNEDIAYLFEIWRQHEDRAIQKIPAVLNSLEKAGFALPVQLYLLHRIGRTTSSEKAYDVLHALSFGGRGLKRLHEIEKITDIEIADFIEWCLKENPAEPGQVVELAIILANEGWDSTRIKDFISVCPKMRGTLDYHIAGSSAIDLLKKGAWYGGVRDLYQKLGGAVHPDLFAWEAEGLPELVAALQQKRQMPMREALAWIGYEVFFQGVPEQRPILSLKHKLGVN